MLKRSLRQKHLCHLRKRNLPKRNPRQEPQPVTKFLSLLLPGIMPRRIGMLNKTRHGLKHLGLISTS